MINRPFLVTLAKVQEIPDIQLAGSVFINGEGNDVDFITIDTLDARKTLTELGFVNTTIQEYEGSFCVVYTNNICVPKIDVQLWSTNDYPVVKEIYRNLCLSDMGELLKRLKMIGKKDEVKLIWDAMITMYKKGMFSILNGVNEEFTYGKTNRKSKGNSRTSS